MPPDPEEECTERDDFFTRWRYLGLAEARIEARWGAYLRRRQQPPPPNG